jgi:TonB family protein
MFLDFYGLRKQPFGVTPDPDFLYLSTTHREALASVAYGIQAGVGFSAVVAKPGMGKTTLLFALLRHFQNSAQSAFLFDTQCNSKELLQNLLAEFKVQQESGGNDASALACLRQFLLKSARANQRVLVVVDEAQNLDIPVFETLRLLSNFETPHAKLLHIVLAGQPELGRKLALPELEQLRQRITIVSRLHVFAPADIIKYVVQRLQLAGYRGGPLFTPDALGALVDKSHGVPREINRLCFNAMSLGCALGKKVIDGELVREAAADLEFGPVPNQEETMQGRRASETVEALAALFSVTLAASADAKNEAARVAVEQNFQPAESAGTIAFESERQSPVATELVPARPKAEQERPADNPAKSSMISAWANRSRRRAAAATALRTRLHSVRGQAAGVTRDVFIWQTGFRNALSRIAQKRPNSRPVVSGSRSPQRPGFRRFVWALSLLVIVASTFGTLVWTHNHLSARDLSRSTKLTSHFAAQTQKLASTFVSETKKSVGQWMTLTKTVAASEEEKNQSKFSPGDSGSIAEASPALSMPKSDLAAATTNQAAPGASATASVGATPAVVPGSSVQRESQATGRPKAIAASNRNSVPARRASGLLAGTPGGSHFVASLSPPAQMSVNPIVSQAPNPPAPEIAAKLIKRVDPIYPELARSADISGNVVLSAHIDEAGKVREVQAISGDPVLVHAAVDAVRQWEYQPLLVNGQPRPSDARIAINFSLR